MTIFVFCGVSGSGKSFVASAFANNRGIPFIEGDDYHSEQSKHKMSNGIPLEDSDRAEWLATLNQILISKTTAALACSSLTVNYRKILSKHVKQLVFVYLEVDKALLQERVNNRTGHFLHPSLLQSQLAKFEPPTEKESTAYKVIQLKNCAKLQDTLDIIDKKLSLLSQ